MKTISEQLDLAAWQHELRAPDGRWVKGGALSHAKAFEFIGKHASGIGAAFLPGNREPEIGDMAHDGHGIFGRVINKAGGHAVVDADDGNRYLVDWRNGGKVGHVVPLSQGGPKLGGMDVHPAPGPAPKKRDAAASSLPGDVIQPGVKQYILPGTETFGSSEYGHNSKPVQNLARLLPKVYTALTPGSGEGKVSWPEQGAQGSTAVVELKDGTKLVSKSQDPLRNDREELSYYVSQAIGGNLPPVARDPANRRDILEGYVEGQTAYRYLEEQTGNGDWAGYSPEDAEDQIASSAEGQDIGLLDYLTSNSDRHEGNWMITPDGSPVPIDMGMAQFNTDDYESPFWHDGDRSWDEAEIAEIRRELAKIQPEFIRLGHPAWYASMIEKLEILAGNDIAGDQYRNLLAGKRDPAVTAMSGATISSQLDLAAWEHEARGPHGEWVKGPPHAYQLPDHARLVSPRGRPPDPASHPFFQAHPVSAANVRASFEAASPQERAQGMRWYADAHDVAAALDPEHPARAAGVIAAFSPQSSWPVNLLNATRSIRRGKAVGPGEAMATGAMQRQAQKILDGADPLATLTSPKIRAFGKLIASGGDALDDRLGQVVIDRHALSVAAGRRLGKKDADKFPGGDRYYQHVADTYRQAAIEISREHGQQISPHQVQAITWLHQQGLNEDADAGSEGRLERGRTTMLEKSWEQWARASEGLPVETGTTLDVVARPITAAEARGNSRPVSSEEFQRLAAEGRSQLRVMKSNAAPITGLDRNWAAVKEKTYAKVQESWGGATIDSHTGHALPDGADAYALSVKPEGLHTVSVPEHASREVFDGAMDRALALFRAELEQQNHYLGIFHDDENHRIDIDPTVVVGDLHSVETIGAYTHAIGGAYHFRSGDGFWPPHVAEAAEMSNEAGSGHHWAGPGQWRSEAAQIQPGLSPQQQADIASDDGDGGSGEDDDPAISWSGLVSSQLDLAGGWRHERRDSHGRWTRGGDSTGHSTDLVLEIANERNNTINDDVKAELTRAFQYLQMNKHAAAVTALSRAAQKAEAEGEIPDRYTELAQKVQDDFWKHQPGDSAGQLAAEITDWTAKAAPHIPRLLGGGKEGWDGTVGIQTEIENPSVLADFGWDGHMRMRQDVAAHIKTALDMHYEPVDDPSAFSVPLHELIHGVYSNPGVYASNRYGYQDSSTADIEEGFTELGTIQHAPDFFDAMGIGGRRTAFIPVDEQMKDIAVNAMRRDTMSEYARRLQDRQLIVDGNAWGHYPVQTVWALYWCEEVAMAEGFKGDDIARRVRELADEVNRQGAGGKLYVMAGQIVRAAEVKMSGADPRSGDINPYQHGDVRISGSLTPNEWNELMDAIRSGWGDGGAAAFQDASKLAHQRLGLKRAAV